MGDEEEILVRLADRSFKRGLTLKIRLPEADRIVRAAWLGVENHDQPALKCDFKLKGGELLVSLPPVGAAGVLRLEQ